MLILPSSITNSLLFIVSSTNVSSLISSASFFEIRLLILDTSINSLSFTMTSIFLLFLSKVISNLLQMLLISSFVLANKGLFLSKEISTMNFSRAVLNLYSKFVIIFEIFSYNHNLEHKGVERLARVLRIKLTSSEYSSSYFLRRLGIKLLNCASSDN